MATWSLRQGQLLERPRLDSVDVLKVPHHGSRYQDPDLLTGLGARLAVVSVGVDNDYGHPAPTTLAMLRQPGCWCAGPTTTGTSQWSSTAGTWRCGAVARRSAADGL